MNKEWFNLIMEFVKNGRQTKGLKCPNCKAENIDYMYVTDECNAGFMAIWCNSCKVGSYACRTITPKNVKTVTFEELDKHPELIPHYTIAQ